MNRPSPATTALVVGAALLAGLGAAVIYATQRPRAPAIAWEAEKAECLARPGYRFVERDPFIFECVPPPPPRKP